MYVRSKFYDKTNADDIIWQGFKKGVLSNKVDKKAMIRNRYNRIPHPALNTKRERDTYN